MNNFNEALRRAIGAGFTHGYEAGACRCSREVYLMNKDFWIALGKAEWAKNPSGPCDYVVFEWRNKWHGLIDYLADGKDIDSYFNLILH